MFTNGVGCKQRLQTGAGALCTSPFPKQQQLVCAHFGTSGWRVKYDLYDLTGR